MSDSVETCSREDCGNTIYIGYSSYTPADGDICLVCEKYFCKEHLLYFKKEWDSWCFCRDCVIEQIMANK